MILFLQRTLTNWEEEVIFSVTEPLANFLPMHMQVTNKWYEIEGELTGNKKDSSGSGMKEGNTGWKGQKYIVYMSEIVKE